MFYFQSTAKIWSYGYVIWYVIFSHLVFIYSVVRFRSNGPHSGICICRSIFKGHTKISLYESGLSHPVEQFWVFLIRRPSYSAQTSQPFACSQKIHQRGNNISEREGVTFVLIYLEQLSKPGQGKGKGDGFNFNSFKM